jgi:trehalose synthase
MEQVRVAGRGLRPYRRVISSELYDEIEELGRDLRGLHVVEVNATPVGGSVAEILRSTLPLRAVWASPLSGT